MKKIISLILALSMLVSMFTFTALAEDIPVFTEDFENGVSGWTIPAAATDKFTATTEDAKSGKSSLKIIDDDDSTTFNYYSKKFSVKPGEEFTLSVDIKVLEGKASAGKVYFRFNDANGAMAYSKSTAGSGNAWVNKTESHIAPANAAVAMIIISSQGAGTGTVLVDNIKVTTNAASTPTTPSAPVISDKEAEKNLNKYPELAPGALENISVGEPINLGAPIGEMQVTGCYTDVKENGDVIFYGAIAGPPAKLFAYDVNNKKILDIKELVSEDGKTPSKMSKGIDKGSDGIFNITTNNQFFRYNPETKELKSYSEYFNQTAVMEHGYADDNGNYYFGTYPDAKLIKYDKASDKLVDLGNMVEGKYIRAMAGVGKNIYMGGIGSPTTQWVKYNIETGEKTVHKNPSLEGKFTEKDVANVYAASSAGKYVVARCKISNLNMYYACVYDTEKDDWVGFIPKTSHMHFTELYDNVMYYVDGIGGTKAGLFTYNPETKETKQIEGIEFENCYFIMPQLVTLKDQVNYPGKTLIAGSETRGLILINLGGKKAEFIKDTLPANYTSTRTLKKGLNSELIISAYAGSKFVVYDTKTDKYKYEGKHQQIEDIAVFRGKYYFGNYGRQGAVSVFDPSTKKDPTQLSYMKGSDPVQDRVFNIVDGGNKVIWGSYPNYGHRGGAVAVYYEDTKETKVYSQPVKDQAIAGLAYKDGKIYVSTSAYAAYGIDSIDAPVHILRMDLETGKIEKDTVVELKTDKNRQYFAGDMIFDNSGNLWVACKKTLLKVNPDTLEIIKEIPIGEGVQPITKVRALPYSMEFGPDGLLYTNIGFKISAINVKTDEVKILANINTNGLTLSEEGDIYYLLNATDIGKLEVSRNKEDGILNNGISLFIGSPNALVKGEKTLIDKANDKVIADTVNGRTLVPVRFIAENYGAEVGWDEATETVTLKMADKTVTIVLNKNEIDINGNKITIDVPAQTIQDRTMLPLRAFVEQVMGKTIFWDDRGLIVITNSSMLNAETDADLVNKIIGKLN